MVDTEITIQELRSLGVDEKTLQLAKELVNLKLAIEEPWDTRIAEGAFAIKKRSLIKAFRLKSRAFLSLLPLQLRMSLELFIANYE
jgi:hypothetical protein